MHLAKSRSAFRIFIFISVIALSAGCHGGSGGSGGDPGDTKGEDVTWKISSISVQSVTDGQPVVEETYTFTYDKEAQTVREVYLSDQGNDSQLSTFTRTDTGWTCHYEIDSGRNGSVNITSDNEYDIIRGFISDNQTFNYNDYPEYDTWYGSYVYTYTFDEYGSHEKTEYAYTSTGYDDAQGEVYVEEVIDNTYDEGNRLVKRDIYREDSDKIDSTYEFTYGSNGKVSGVVKKEFTYSTSETVDVTKRTYTRVGDSPSEWDYNTFVDYLIGSMSTGLVSFQNINGLFVETREEIYRGNDSVRESVTNFTYDQGWRMLKEEIDSNNDGTVDSTITHTLAFDDNGKLTREETPYWIVTYTWTWQ